MSYSCNDLADDVFNTCAQLGLITKRQLSSKKLDDDEGSVQADFIMNGITKLHAERNRLRAEVRTLKASLKLAVEQKDPTL